MNYTYAVLRTEISQKSNRHNDALLGSNTLGIEVTTPVLADRCELGNIDPQHNSEKRDSSAIEQALTFPLPSRGACLVTIRPDKDSFGAMAVLELRSRGMGNEIDRYLVAWIGLIDREGFRRAQELHLELKPKGNETEAIQMIISEGDKRWPTIGQKVEAIAQILVNRMSMPEINKIAALKTRIQFDLGDPEIYEGGEMAFLEAPYLYRQARNWCNARFNVALIHDPKYITSDGSRIDRWSVVRKTGHFDREGFEVAINELEANTQGIPFSELTKSSYGWGGNKNIISSSTALKSKLDKEVIVNLVVEYATSGVVT